MIFSKIVALNVLTSVSAAPVKSNSTSGVITLPLQKVRDSGEKHNVTKRYVIGEDLDYTTIRYMANFQIGGQNQYVFLDTGSSNTWVYSDQVWSGGYNPNESSTWQWQNNDFSVCYGDCSVNIVGSWGTDTVTVGDAFVKQYPFALLNESNSYFPVGSTHGILAIGPKASEDTNPEYSTFMENLKDSGVIQSNSFSLFSDASNSEATLLMGGIDTAKFNAPLYTLPIDTANSEGIEFYSVDFEYNGVTYANGALDTGTPIIRLGQDVVDQLASENNYSWNEDWQYYTRDTPPPQSDQPELEFKIGGIPITIPGSASFYEDVGPTYVFAYGRTVSVGDEVLHVLGDPILRQLYLFFDIDNSQVGFAPIVQTDASQPVAVGSTIPDSTPAPNQPVNY